MELSFGKSEGKLSIAMIDKGGLFETIIEGSIQLVGAS